MWVPSSLHRLVDALKKLPGIGQRSAERITFYLTRDKSVLGEIITALTDAKDGLSFCSVCHVITDVDPCPLCSDPTREQDTLIVVERPQDVFLFESLGTLKGRYHVLGGVLSPLDDVGPGDLFLGLVLQVLELNHLVFDFGLAEDHRDAGVHLVRTTELALERPAAQVGIDA